MHIISISFSFTHSQCPPLSFFSQWLSHIFFSLFNPVFSLSMSVYSSVFYSITRLFSVFLIRNAHYTGVYVCVYCGVCTLFQSYFFFSNWSGWKLTAHLSMCLQLRAALQCFLLPRFEIDRVQSIKRMNVQMCAWPIVSDDVVAAFVAKCVMLYTHT